MSGSRRDVTEGESEKFEPCKEPDISGGQEERYHDKDRGSPVGKPHLLADSQQGKWTSVLQAQGSELSQKPKLAWEQIFPGPPKRNAALPTSSYGPKQKPQPKHTVCLTYRSVKQQICVVLRHLW